MNIFDSYIDAGQKLKQSERKEYYCALVEYLAYGKEPERLKGSSDAIWTAIFPSLELSRKRSESGSKGGQKKQANQELATKQNEDLLASKTASKTEANTVANGKANGVAKSKSNSKSNSKEDISNDISKKKSADLSAITEIVDYLNQATNKNFKASRKDTQSFINARTREGFTIDDFKAVIDGRVKAWATDPKMSEYLRPQTLFGTKFESYLNASKAKPKTDEEEWDELFEEYARYERENTTIYCPPC